MYVFENKFVVVARGDCLCNKSDDIYLWRNCNIDTLYNRETAENFLQKNLAYIC